MRNDETNPMTLRYAADGHAIARLPIETMVCLKSLQVLSKDDVLKQLVAGHSYRLEDGGWLELENRHC